MIVEQAAAVSGLPWTEILSSGGGLGLFVAALWMFLRHLKEVQQQTAEADARKSATIEKISADFSSTVKGVAADVNNGLAKLNETTNLLLADGRERENRLHKMFRELAEDRP